MAWWEYLIPGYNVARAGYGAATGNWGVGNNEEQPPEQQGPRLGPDGKPLPPSPGDYLDPNNQLLANWWESMYGSDYGGFGSEIDSRTDEYGYDRRRYRDAADRGYGVDDPTKTPAHMQYSPEEQAGILREEERRAALTTPEEYAGMYRSGDENAAIGGDPYAGYNAFQGGMSGLNRDLDFSEQRTFDTLGEQDRNVRRIGDDFRQTSAGRLDSGTNAIRGAVTTGRTDYGNAIDEGSAGFNSAIDQGERGYGAAIDEGSAGIREATGDPRLQLDAGYSGRVDDILTQGEGNVRDIYQDPNLDASQEFMDQYQFTDQDMSDLEALAGTAAGARYRDLQSDIERRAASGGQTSASALATIKGRFQRQAAQEAADAVLDARTRGRGMQLDTVRGREDVRLAAEQANANRGVGAELELGDRRYGAETLTEQMRIAASQRAAQMRQTGETDIMGARIGTEGDLLHARMTGADRTMTARTGAARDLMAATQAGESDIMHTGLDTAARTAGFDRDSEMGLTDDRLREYGREIGNRLDVGKFGTSGAAEWQAKGEGMASDRARDAANHRTDTAKYTAGQRSNQEMGLADRFSAGSSQIADARLAGGKEQRGYLAGSTDRSTQAELTSSGQRQAQYATKFGASNQAAGLGANLDTERKKLAAAPKAWERLAGAGLGAVSGYFAGGN
jgi:hypothetical protein